MSSSGSHMYYVVNVFFYYKKFATTNKQDIKDKFLFFRKMTLDLLYFIDVSDVNLSEKNFGRSTLIHAEQIPLYKFHRFKKETIDTAKDYTSQARHFKSMGIYGF